MIYMRKLLSFCLIFLVVLMLQIQAIAVMPETYSGVCGTRTIWSLTGGILTLSGEGSIDSAYPSPWNDYKNQITKIVVKEGITEIGDCIFIDHKNLLEVQLPESLRHLGGQVFQGCDKLEQIFIPKNVEVIGNPGTYRTPATTFSCAVLQSVDVAPENKYFHSIDGILFDSANHALLCYPQGKSGVNYVIPDGIKEIAAGAFWFSELQGIELPDSLEVIGDSAFSSTHISTIEIPNTVREIPRSTFSNCDQLKSMTIPKSVQSIGRDTFASCDALEKLIFLTDACNISNVTSTIPKKTVLHGYWNSAVQTYALTYGYKFVDSQTGTIYNYDAGNEGLLDLLPTDISASCPVFNRVTEGGDTIGGYQPTLVLETDLTNTTYQEMLAFTESLTADCTTDYQKANAIFCWVNDNMTYEYAHFGVGETTDGIYQLWSERYSNCEGYTQLNNFLLYLAGIPNAIATSIDHCWTVALLDGEWCMIDTTNRIFDQAPNDCADIKNIFFGVDSTLVCVIDDMTGVKLASYGLDVRDNYTYQEITIPEYITHIYGCAFNYRDNSPDDPYVTIYGTVGSYAQTYVEENLPEYSIDYNGNQFVATVKPITDESEHTHILRLIPFAAATHETAGNIEHYICTGCEAFFTDSSAGNKLTIDQTIIPAEGHQYKEYFCDSTNHWLVCGCGKNDSATEHSWNHWIIVSEATATETGVEKHVCAVCGYEETREIPRLSIEIIPTDPNQLDSSISTEAPTNFACPTDECIQSTTQNSRETSVPTNSLPQETLNVTAEDDSLSANNPYLWIIIVAVCSIGMASVVFIWRNKKSI